MPTLPRPWSRGLIGPVAALLLALTPVRAASGDPEPVGVWPLVPRPEVVHGFDPPDSPYGAGHRGVDLAGRPGQGVRAALAGRVTFAGSLAGKGVVVVDHGATRTTYEPVAAGVAVGEAVAAGERIGRLLVPGSHCFPRACLHWGWIRNVDDVYLDPLRLVGAGPVRLLPLWRDRPVGTATPLTNLYAGLLRLADGPAGRPGAGVRW
jgi:murein DD-endopeptidase MepM/ murein hydrolase activator NlpD